MPANQPDPKTNDNPAVWHLVIADMLKRDHVGRQRCGTPLQAGNGRDALQDAYEEALDLSVYLRQAIEERKLKASLQAYGWRCLDCGELNGIEADGTVWSGRCVGIDGRCGSQSLVKEPRNPPSPRKAMTRAKAKPPARDQLSFSVNDVLSSRKGGGGCCDDYLDNKACGCLERATCRVCHDPNCRNQNGKH